MSLTTEEKNRCVKVVRRHFEMYLPDLQVSSVGYLGTWEPVFADEKPIVFCEAHADRRDFRVEVNPEFMLVTRIFEKMENDHGFTR